MAKWICYACSEAESRGDLSCKLETPIADMPEFCPVTGEPEFCPVTGEENLEWIEDK